MSISPALIRGLLPEDPFVETYIVHPGGATVFALAPDERMTVVDTRGSQAAEISVLGPDGRDDAAALDARADAPATVIRAALTDLNGSLLAHELGARGLDPTEATAIRLFGEWSPAGSAQTFRAERAVTIVVAAPAGRIVDGAPPPSELVVEVRRSTPRSYEQQELPPPPVINEIVHKDKPAVPAVPVNLFMEDPSVLPETSGYRPLSGTSLSVSDIRRIAQEDMEFVRKLGPFGVGEIINRETAPPGTEFFATGLNSIGSLKDGLFNVDGEKLA
jgi:hypothetical protein